MYEAGRIKGADEEAGYAAQLKSQNPKPKPAMTFEDWMSMCRETIGCRLHSVHVHGAMPCEELKCTKCIPLAKKIIEGFKADNKGRIIT